jgi:type IV secretion system protein TrbI
MTQRATSDPERAANAGPESLELRAKPPPITRINRKVLFAAVALGLFFLAGLVMVALDPPRFANRAPSELYNVEQKVTPEALNKLPASYEGINVPRSAPQTVQAPAPFGPKIAGPLDGDREAELERARLAKLNLQAREAGLFFRLQLKAPPGRDQADARMVAEAKAEMAAPSLSSLTALRHAIGDDDPRIDPTDQMRKLAFLKDGPEKQIYNAHALQTPASPYQLMAGSIISASLVTGLNSDLPGFVIAQVTEHVYDTVTGRHLLIPQGTRLAGKYDNVVAFGQKRALLIWQRLILPDGSSIVIDNLPATDTGGYAGLADEVDLHTWKLLKGVALATVLGVGSELAFGASDSDLVRALQLSTQSTTNRAGQRLVERNLNVQPTITVRPGWPLRVIVHRDLVLRPYRGPGIVNR